MQGWGFNIQKNIIEYGLDTFVRMKGKYFDNLVPAFYIIWKYIKR